jgi:pimeloyl-ACP methyl ester carboxylesterase
MATAIDTDAPVELVPGKLYRLGGTVPMDGRLSWVPASWQGPDSLLHEALNSDLLIEGDRAMLVDSGVTVHREAIVAQIAGARLAVIPGAGHYVPVERTRETAAVIEAFLAGLG